MMKSKSKAGKERKQEKRITQMQETIVLVVNSQLAISVPSLYILIINIFRIRMDLPINYSLKF